jgi:hypothetical protein
MTDRNARLIDGGNARLIDGGNARLDGGNARLLTEPLPPAPHPALTPLDGAYWRVIPIAWDSARFHDIVAAWLADPEHLRALLTDRPDWCESTRACDFAVANLFDTCINYRPCARFLTPGAARVTYIAHTVDFPRERRVETVPPAQFAVAAMRALLPHVLRACREVMPVRIPLVLCGVRGVWTGPAIAARDMTPNEAAIEVAWGDDDGGMDHPLAALAGQVVADLTATDGRAAAWMDVLMMGDGHGRATPDARRAAKVARCDILRALRRSPSTNTAAYKDIT